MTRYRLEVVADNLGRFADFGPYVPALSGHGVVAWQATCRDGRSGVFLSDGREYILGAGDEVLSHPAVTSLGHVSVFARIKGAPCLTVAEPEQDLRLAELPQEIEVGPLGPTMNERGDVAFRGKRGQSGSGLFVWLGGQCVPVARAGT